MTLVLTYIMCNNNTSVAIDVIPILQIDEHQT